MGGVTVGGAGESSVDALYARHRMPLTRLAAVVTGDLDAASEIVQDAFADLVQSGDAVHEPVAWLRRAVTNRSTSWIRRRIVARRYLPRLVVEDSVPAQHEIDLCVRDALAKLSPQHRSVLFLRFYLDLSEAEIAQTLQIPQGTVKSRLSRALRTLRETTETSEKPREARHA